MLPSHPADDGKHASGDMKSRLCIPHLATAAEASAYCVCHHVLYNSRGAGNENALLRPQSRLFCREGRGISGLSSGLQLKPPLLSTYLCFNLCYLNEYTSNDVQMDVNRKIILVATYALFDVYLWLPVVEILRVELSSFYKSGYEPTSFKIV